MPTHDRRRLLQTAAVTSAAALAAAAMPGTAAAEEAKKYELDGGPGDWTDAERLDYRNIRIAGFTHDEAICWLLVARATLAIFDLPEQHPSDIPEVVTLVHGIQNKLLARPTYRDYMEAYQGDTEADALATPPKTG
ncbi:hypothetical protein LX16_3764 [Stackebrandtia albiflava]|uniref:Tyrosinase co-factor MelC1 n=1 Tax=Stackebrandtia albiflava TaxID=406432 RepID=A0A562V5B6_9ACTN|nr:hypothetical protein [Stackebrandtia albiflava]TWJ12997.1 hypothetical protein LX16_3764 [Stackebrandtia albiflava]